LLSGSPVAIVCETWKKKQREREREREQRTAVAKHKKERNKQTNKQTTWGKKKRMELRTMSVWCAED
jgi:hypothetical protein